jgi:hypothetical protein
MKERDSLEDFLTTLIEQPNQYNQLQLLLNNTKPNPSFHRFPLQLLFAKLPNYIASIERLKRFKYRYSLEVEVFADCVADNPFLKHSSFLELVCVNPIVYLDGLTCRDTKVFLSAFLADLKQRLLSKELKHQAIAQQKQMNRSYKEMCGYVDGLFAHYARLVVVDVVLFYPPDTDVDIERLQQDLKRFYDSMSKLPKTYLDAYGNEKLAVFNGLVGQIWKIEYGTDKGLHVHALFFYDGSKRQYNADWHLAEEIGKHWSVMVGAQDTYWNCHSDKNYYEKNGLCGIGVIHYSDIERINNLKRIIQYFCKRQQYIKPRDKPKMRLIRSGNLPDTDGVKRGAPRKGIVDDVNEKV